jgi:hypothetical protein
VNCDAWFFFWLKHSSSSHFTVCSSQKQMAVE